MKGGYIGVLFGSCGLAVKRSRRQLFCCFPFCLRCCFVCTFGFIVPLCRSDLAKVLASFEYSALALLGDVGLSSSLSEPPLQRLLLRLIMLLVTTRVPYSRFGACAFSRFPCSARHVHIHTRQIVLCTPTILCVSVSHCYVAKMLSRLDLKPSCSTPLPMSTSLDWSPARAGSLPSLTSYRFRTPCSNRTLPSATGILPFNR